MKYIIPLLSMVFSSYVMSMNTRHININNKSDQIVPIAYREPNGIVIKKLLPGQSLNFSSTTEILAIKNHGKVEKFSMQRGDNDFVITNKRK